MVSVARLGMNAQQKEASQREENPRTVLVPAHEIFLETRTWTYHKFICTEIDLFVRYLSSASLRASFQLSSTTSCYNFTLL